MTFLNPPHLPDNPSVGFQLDGRFRDHFANEDYSKNTRTKYNPAAVDRMIAEYFEHFADEFWITEARAQGLFSQYFAIMDAPSNIEGIVYSLQRLIWQYDDINDDKNARKYRRILAEHFLDAHIASKAGIVQEFYRLVKVDTLRRAGMFFKARSYLSSLSFENDILAGLAVYEKNWIRKRDPQCYTDAVTRVPTFPYKPKAVDSSNRKRNVTDIEELITNGITTDSDRYLMGHSLFYYCSGNDPTPILAFGGEYPLYLYLDIADSFNTDILELFDYLRSYGYKMGFGESIKGGSRWGGNKNMVLSSWVAPDGRHFFLVNICAHAEGAFRLLYADNSNYVQPGCICNYRYEFIDHKSQSSEAFFQTIEKRTEFILGHCFNEKYKVVGGFAYHGNYDAPTETVKLYRRKYWYVY